ADIDLESMARHGRFDVETALERVAGNKTMYLDLLEKFNKKYAGGPGEIKEALAKNDAERAAFFAHTIAGLAGTIGAIDAERAGRALEAAIREENKERISFLADDFEKEMNRAMAFIHRPGQTTGRKTGRPERPAENDE
ncbi:MAG: Hpt domain-containing protein, partial [Desulfobacterales bacterium]|nr:Hpt domain-containing protein [Desulfobacterales bacterium]